jgi:hypothetical protein
LTSYIQNVAHELATTLSKKNSDYAPTDEFSNFRMAAELPGIDMFDVMLGQIGIKYTRLMSLVQGVLYEGAEYEGVRDTLVDLAGYAVIAAAYLDDQVEKMAELQARIVPLHGDEDA